MSSCFIASTKGFDEFYAENPSVVSEKRLYPLSIHKGRDQDHVMVEAKVNYYENTEANTVEVKGSWDEWKTPVILSKDAKGVFRGSVNVYPGTHFYKFIVDGNWVCDHTKALIIENGHMNNVLRVQKEYKIYQNMVQARGILNSIHKKISTRYPEFYLNQLVFSL
jgi:Glycogen recognition site of AMP-activated protein kinase